MGNPAPLPVYWDKLLINASQVTNPSIDPLREPMETARLPRQKAVLKASAATRTASSLTDTPPQLKLRSADYVLRHVLTALSAITRTSPSRSAAGEARQRITTPAKAGLHQDFYKYGEHTIVQVASGRFGVNQRLPERGRGD